MFFKYSITSFWSAVLRLRSDAGISSYDIERETMVQPSVKMQKITHNLVPDRVVSVLP